MTGSANVRSLDAVVTARTALVTFGDRVDQALGMIDVELRRVLDWLEHDRPRHWRTQIRLAADGVAEARAALQRALMYPIADERPSCREERAALKRAEERLAYCEQKAERLKHWTREVRHQLFEYEGRISQLVRVVEADVPEAVAVLGRIIDHLQEYQAEQVRSIRPAYDDAALAAKLWADRPAGDSNNKSIEPTSEAATDEEQAVDEGTGR